jgi:mannose/fructose/N-acetylgalactosamine-specific phosphotransferase system component IIC
MKYLILILTIAAFTSIILGFTLQVPYTQKLIGFGVVGLFLVVFPLFSYHRWKDKDPKDYMLTKENLDKMRDNQKEKKY